MKKIDIPVPYLKDDALETFDLSIKTSSTSVDTSRYRNSLHDNNILNWELYKRVGWGGYEMNGDYTTDSGIACRASYTFEGNVSSSLYATINGAGSLRYEYYVSDPYDGGSTMTFHMSTSTKTATSTVRVLP